MSQMAQEATLIGESSRQHAFELAQGIDGQELLPAPDQGKQFDPQEARRLVLDETAPPSEVLEFVQSDSVEANEEMGKVLLDTTFLHAIGQLGEENSGLDEEETPLIQTTEERCLVADAPSEIKLQRQLSVAVHHQPAVYQEGKICRGHSFEKVYGSKKKAQKRREELERELAQPWFKSRSVWMDKVGPWSYQVNAHWQHQDDIPECDSFTPCKRLVEEERWVEEDQWVFDQERFHRLIQSPNCTLVERRCLDTSPIRVIEKREVRRRCWLEELIFASTQSTTTVCPFLNNPKCQLVRRSCVEESPHGCALWKLCFECQRSIPQYSERAAGIYIPPPSPQDESVPSASFAEVTTKLAVLAEVKEELEEADALDPSSVELFKGSSYQCNKSVSDELLYDCCFAHKGLAQTLQLAQCSAEELDLADRRERGQCHYIGRYSEKLVDLLKTKDVHVFCCFKSRLGRVLQEAAREQLQIDWGSAKRPNCRGLSNAELTRLNFDHLDLSELYDTPGSSPQELQERVNKIGERVSQRLKERASA